MPIRVVSHASWPIHLRVTALEVDGKPLVRDALNLNRRRGFGELSAGPHEIRIETQVRRACALDGDDFETVQSSATQRVFVGRAPIVVAVGLSSDPVSLRSQVVVTIDGEPSSHDTTEVGSGCAPMPGFELQQPDSQLMPIRPVGVDC